MKLEVVYPDASALTAELLADEIAIYEPDVNVVNEPIRGARPEYSHETIEVAWDGTPLVAHPVVEHATIRVTAWALTRARAIELVSLAQGLLLAHAGGMGIARIGALTGVLPARDPVTNAELASVTVRVSVRSQPIPESS